MLRQHSRQPESRPTFTFRRGSAGSATSRLQRQTKQARGHSASRPRNSKLTTPLPPPRSLVIASCPILNSYPLNGTFFVRCTPSQEWMGKREISEKTFTFTKGVTFGLAMTIVIFPAMVYSNIKSGMETKDAKMGRKREYF